MTFSFSANLALIHFTRDPLAFILSRYLLEASLSWTPFASPYTTETN